MFFKYTSKLSKFDAECEKLQAKCLLLLAFFTLHNIIINRNFEAFQNDRFWQISSAEVTCEICKRPVVKQKKIPSKLKTDSKVKEWMFVLSEL